MIQGEPPRLPSSSRKVQGSPPMWLSGGGGGGGAQAPGRFSEGLTVHPPTSKEACCMFVYHHHHAGGFRVPEQIPWFMYRRLVWWFAGWG